MDTSEIVLIDLSSIAYPAWLTSSAEPDPDATKTKIVARVRGIATGKAHVAVCCDSGRSFRHDLADDYKANRPPREEALHYQIRLACEALEQDGFPVWSRQGFEADDLIASAVAKILAAPEITALIVSSDKDLLQLVGPRVRAMSARDGAVFDQEAVFAKFGVTPDQMRDYLTLVGDASDNVVGARGIGAKIAARLLLEHQTIEGIYAAFDRNALPAGVAKSLAEFRARMPLTRNLITLRADVELPFHEVLQERVPHEIVMPGFAEEEDMDTEYADATEAAPDAAPTADAPAADSAPATALAVREPDVLSPAPKEWERQLDPRSLREAKTVAMDMFQSRMFSGYGNAQAVLSTVMVGRELGLPAMASLRTIHIIEGKHALSASLMVALVLRSGLAEYFEPISFSETEATFETKRKGARNPVKLTHTVEMAKLAGLVKDKSGWMKNPTDMVVARAQARLARMVYPDLLAGLYTPEELTEIREQVAA